MSQPVTITTSTVPSNFCFTTWQQSWTELVSLLTGSLAGDNTTFNIGKTAPSAANQNKPWFRLFSNGSPDRWYYFWNGLWVSQIIPYDLNERGMYTGTPAQIYSYDGGSGDDPTVPGQEPTLVTGATWQIDTDMSARFVVGVGSFANAGDVTVKDTVTSTGVEGEDEHTLVIDELPEHYHTADTGASVLGDIATSWGGVNRSTTVDTVDRLQTKPVGSDDPHNNLPPFYAVYFIKRTARQFYTV